ncbi:class I SAM-dependent methyltransferase [Shimazuella kribbensis]|uniref:class I SAM-dependent methyltransferase n=1 Tax=Shimazuella kribbensis TaxID=139808 RepID=UPI0004131EE6|nr:class I SAM-dependent methyltransferase [Shimazuella kribbensis]
MKNIQPSRTAQSVAAHYLLLSYDPNFGKLVPKEAIQPLNWFLSELSGAARASLYLYRIPLLRSYFRWVEQKILPGFSLHIALRKHWIESQVKEAIHSGTGQVVVLGAGFDTLAYRLHKTYPNVNFIELDHIATQQIKLKALERHANMQGNLYLTSADFTQHSLTEILRFMPAFQAELPTIYIAEGLLMYLPEVDVLSMFRQLSTLHKQTCQVVGTAIEPQNNGELTIRGTGKTKIDPSNLGEPLLWGTRSVDLPAFLTICDFQTVFTKYTQDLLSETIPELHDNYSLPKEEYLFIAR